MLNIDVKYKTTGALCVMTLYPSRLFTGKHLGNGVHAVAALAL